MRDPRLDKLAHVLVNYSTKIRKGDLVAITADPIAMPLTVAVYEAVLKAGGHPFWQPRSDELADSFLQYADDHHLDYVSPLSENQVETIDAQISFWAEVNTKSMTNVDPAKQARKSRAQKNIFNRFMARAAEGALRWVGTQYPTQAAAQDAEMSLREYENFVFRAGLLHLDDPSAAWQKISESQQRLCDYLSTKEELHFQNPNGTDLRVAVNAPAVWVNCAGNENFPDGEVFTGPQNAHGIVHYSFPAVHMGREAHDIQLTFKDNKVVDAQASKGLDFLTEMLDMDPGARTMGEIAVGTNYNIKNYTKNTLFDEKIGGTFHAAVGAGYPESGSTNESALHWDMVCDMRTGGTISADGEVFHRDGKFLDPTFPGN